MTKKNSGNQTEMSSPCKKTSNEITKVTFESIKDNEKNDVKELLRSLTLRETSLFDIFKIYMTQLALNSDKKWYTKLKKN